MEVLFFWAAFSLAVAMLAQSRSRSPWGWFTVAVLFSPLIAGLFLLVLGHGGVECWACRKKIHSAAVICPYCRSARVA